MNRPRATRKTIDVALKKNIRLALEEISNEISAIEEFDRELNAEQLFEKKDSTYEVSSNKPFTGVSVEYYKNGQLKEKTFYRGGKENGPYQAHHESGKLMGRGTYKDGKLIGAFETFYENGRLWFKVLYDDGKQVSREMYHEDGQKVSL